MNRRIGILGGTFDPIHCGHVDLALAAERALQLARLFLIPANLAPQRQHTFASGFHRFAMVALTVSGRSGWLASDLELRTAAVPSYSIATLERFHERGCAPTDLFFVIGADAFAEVNTWKNSSAVLDAAHFAVVSRPGHSVEDLPQRLPQLASRMTRPPIVEAATTKPFIFLIDAPTADVSSTAIRRLRAEGRPITGLVDLGVEQHIEQHGLYASSVPGRRGSDRPSTHAASRLHGKG
jgi:nicotinate-nucleotide adenylyltransferase